MKYDLVLKLQTNSDFTSWEVGGKLLSGIFSEARLAPQKVATFGEVTAGHGHDVDCFKNCKPYWASKATIRIGGSQRDIIEDFHWKRQKVTKSQGYVKFTSTNVRNKTLPGWITLYSQYRKEIDWAGLFVNWCEIVSPFAAILHPAISKDGPEKSSKDIRDFTREENIQQNAWSRFLGGELYCEFRAGELNSLVTGLTNLGWASWFGGEFAKEVDEAAIADAGFPIQRIGDGYLIQVTEDIHDVINDCATPTFRSAR